MNKTIMVFGAMLACVCGVFAEPVATDVVAKQRYPWNGLVDITCDVSGGDETTMVVEYKRMMIPKEVLWRRSRHVLPHALAKEE